MAKVIKRDGKIGVSLLLVLLVFGLFFYSARVFTFGQSEELISEPGITELAEADIYLANQHYTEAEQAYKDIAILFPGTDAALQAQKSLVLLYIDLRDDTSADDALNKLVIDFYEHQSVSVAVFELSKKYQQLCRDEDAANLSQYIVNNWPESNEAVWSQADISIRAATISDDPNDNSVAIYNLLNNFTGNPDTPKAALKVADFYQRLRKYGTAVGLYRYIADNWSAATEALKSQTAIVILSSRLNADITVRDKEIDTLLAVFSGHEELPDAVIQIAYNCLEEKDYQKASVLYDYVVNNFPDESLSVNIQSSLALFNSDIGIDPNAAEVDVESLIINNESDTELPEAVSDIAKRYYKKSLTADNNGIKAKASQYLQKTISSLELMSNSSQGIASVGSEACNILAQSYRRSGQFLNAIDTYEKLLETFPDYQHPWHIEFAIGSCYQQMKQSGLVSIDEADSKTKALYENLLWKYPTCKSAKGARNWLDHLAGLEEGSAK